MSNIVKAKVSIVGTKPFLWHHFGPEAMPADGKKERNGVAGNDPTEWKRTVLKSKDGVLYIEGSYIFGSLRGGAKHTKKGKGSIQSDVSATLQIEDDIILTNRVMPDDITEDKTLPVYLDIRSVVNPSTKGRNVRYRVASSIGWRLSFSILFDKTVVGVNQMHAVCIDAGKLVGLGSGRAIGFGRFDVVSFDVTD